MLTGHSTAGEPTFRCFTYWSLTLPVSSEYISMSLEKAQRQIMKNDTIFAIELWCADQKLHSFYFYVKSITIASAS
jgi:hypothetical protein